MNILRVAFISVCIIGVMQELFAGSEDDTSAGTTYLHPDSKSGYSWLATPHTGLKYSKLTLKKQKKVPCKPHLERMCKAYRAAEVTLKLAAGKVQHVLQNLDKKRSWTSLDEEAFADALKQIELLESVVGKLPEQYNQAVYLREFESGLSEDAVQQSVQPQKQFDSSKDFITFMRIHWGYMLRSTITIALICGFYVYKRMRKQEKEDAQNAHEECSKII